MQRLIQHLRVGVIYIIAVVLIGAAPLTAFADTGATYDPATGHWNTGQWYFDASTGQYQPVPTPDPVVMPVVVDVVDPVVQSDSVPTSPDAQPSVIVSEPSSITTVDATTATAITNNQTADATTGNAAVVNNTLAAHAASGNASDASTTLNMVNSSVGGESSPSGVASFISNISGDVYGDIYINPMIIGALSLQSAANPSVGAQADVALNAATVNAIANKINLNAATGSATVAGNTSAGDATSGNANAVANVMNIINSIIGANQSFVGTINIYGNLNGDILIAPDFIPQLLAGNTQLPSGGSIAANITDTQTIANIVNVSAGTGTASVVGNTLAGQATTGTAQTNIVILNLSGHQIVASNSLLVFVNVLGKWVGVIVDAPVGATAAALASGVSENNMAQQSLSATTDTVITNDITVTAKSGDASVIGNTSAGNATSGNATASANILNMTQTSFGLAGWFGVLFINVFGSWFGSFGIDTDSGNTPVPPATTFVESSSALPAAFTFVPKLAPANQPLFAPVSAAISQTPSTPTSATVAAVVTSPVATSQPSPERSDYTKFIVMMVFIAGAIGALGVALRGGWSVLLRRIRGLVTPQ
jgi:uncharacterized membrane protein